MAGEFTYDDFLTHNSKDKAVVASAAKRFCWLAQSHSPSIKPLT
jgi:hypothetical protein